MRKIYKAILTITVGILSLKSTSQVSLYTFSQLSGTYTSISGGTVFGTTTSDDDTWVNAGAPTSSGDMGIGIPIGFNFTYDNIVFDCFGINCNGWIGFGQSTITPNPVNISNTGSNYTGISSASGASPTQQYRVAGISRDLQAQSGGPRVQTIGTSPNQVCVIQWTNYKKWNNTGDDYNFQIRLYETTNRIEVVYGNFINNGNSTTAEVGLRGASNTDFNNRIVNTGNPWIISIPGTANNSAVSINNSGLTPNMGQIYRWDAPVPCSGPPASNAASSQFGVMCPGGSTYLSLANSYSTTGNTYQWYVSDQSAVGPYTLMTSATEPIIAVSNITVTSWYQAVVVCNNVPAPPASSTTTPVNVIIAGTTTNSVPYYEGFEGVVVNNQLPNCSWSASSPTTINQTYIATNTNNRIPHTGSKFASFRNNTNATGDYFYSNGIQLEPGVTYSAAVWYITDGNVGWSELSMSYGSSQTSTGLTSIASLTGAVAGQFYQLLSNTFTVPNSGLYYIAIKCIGSASPQYLTFDDLSVTVPCSLNSPTINVVTTPTLVCIGQPVTMVASGADTYNWSNGNPTSSITFTPFSNTGINVVGTSTLSGCSITFAPAFNPNASPVISIFSNSQSVCMGSTSTLHAFGANTYTWNTGISGSSATFAPTASTTYSVKGSNAIGCEGSSSITLNIKNLPVISAVSSRGAEICVNETTTLTATGAMKYEWKSNSTIILTEVAYVSPKATTVYTLTGTDVNGCSTTTLVAISVSECTGLNENVAGLNNIILYPNPANNDFTIELNNGLNKQIEIIDVTGRNVMTSNSNDDKINLTINELSAGIYYVKVTSGNGSEVIKLIKN